jgi:hypothetical protein
MPIKSYDDLLPYFILLGHFLLSEIVYYYYYYYYYCCCCSVSILLLNVKMLLMITQTISSQIKVLFSGIYSLFYYFRLETCIKQIFLLLQSPVLLHRLKPSKFDAARYVLTSHFNHIFLDRLYPVRYSGPGGRRLLLKGNIVFASNCRSILIHRNLRTFLISLSSR